MAATTTVELKQDFDRKLEIVMAGLPKEYSNLLEKIPREDIMAVIDYMISLKAEVNPSENYRRDAEPGFCSCSTLLKACRWQDLLAPCTEVPLTYPTRFFCVLLSILLWLACEE